MKLYLYDFAEVSARNAATQKSKFYMPIIVIETESIMNWITWNSCVRIVITKSII